MNSNFFATPDLADLATDPADASENADLLVDEAFSRLKSHHQQLRSKRAALEESRIALFQEIDRVKNLPPDKAELKTILKKVVDHYTAAWAKPFLGQLDQLKTGAISEFVRIHSALAGNDDFIHQNGWTALIGMAMLSAIDGFVDGLDWPPDGISNDARQARILEIEFEIAPIIEEMAMIDDRLKALEAF